MDLLFKRYADPFSFLNGMIQTGRLAEFVESLMDITLEEKNEKANWEYFLHKVWEGSFAEFKESIKNDSKTMSMPPERVEATINDSLNILKSFNPQEKGGDL